jgi:hypothetical protein
MKKMHYLTLAVVTVGAVICGGTLVAYADQQNAADDQANLVEDYSYPDAAKIAAADNVVLISGDGHILFADCAQPLHGIGQIEVHSSVGVGPNHDGDVCFKVTAPTGHLTLKLPSVYEIRGDGRDKGTGHHATADLTTDAGVRTTVTVAPDGSTPVGVASPSGQDTTLLALDVIG